MELDSGGGKSKKFSKSRTTTWPRYNICHLALSQSGAVLVCSAASVSWVHQSNVLEGKDQLNGQLQMQMRDKKLKKMKVFLGRGEGGSPKCTSLNIALCVDTHLLKKKT